MTWLIKLLAGSFGPYIAGAMAATLALAIGTATVQSARLSRTKEDLAKARAALVNPVTRKTWQSEATRDAAALGTCRSNTETLQTALASQNASVAAMKAEGDRRAAMLADALQAARKAASAANAKADRILSIQPAGADVCSRFLDVDRQIQGIGR